MHDQQMTETPAERGRDTPSRHDTGWQPGDTGWVTWVALLPILLLVLSVLVAVVDGDSWPLLDYLVITWLFAGLIGLIVFVPAIVVSLFGAASLKRQFRRGRRLASIGSAAIVPVVAVLTYVIVTDTMTFAEQQDSDGWDPSSSPLAASLVLIPYLAIAALNVYVIVRLWRRAR